MKTTARSVLCRVTALIAPFAILLATGCATQTATTYTGARLSEEQCAVLNVQWVLQKNGYFVLLRVDEWTLPEDQLFKTRRFELQPGKRTVTFDYRTTVLANGPDPSKTYLTKAFYSLGPKTATIDVRSGHTYKTKVLWPPLDFSNLYPTNWTVRITDTADGAVVGIAQ